MPLRGAAGALFRESGSGQTCPRSASAASAPNTTENAIANRIRDGLNWLAGGLRLRQCDMPASIASH